MNLLEKVNGILREPSKTFEHLKHETLKETLKYYAVLAAGFSLLNGTIAMLGISSSIEITNLELIKGSGGGGYFMIYLLIFSVLSITFLLFLDILIVHISVYIGGGRKGFRQTMKSSIYSFTPLIFGWVPIVGIIALLWSYVTQIIGIRQLHELTTKQALLITFIFIPLISGTVIAFITLIGALIYGLSSQ